MITIPMPQRLIRIITIIRVVTRYGLDDALLSVPFFKSLRFIYNLLPWNWRKKEYEASLGVRIRLALEELGPIFIKFGQMLSTRNDLLHPDIAIELRQLQDNVPPFSSEEAQAIIESSLQNPIHKLFKQFDPKPLASASIAQVHTATLWDNNDVIIKVLRPDIKPIIESDIKLMYLLARLLNRYWKEAKRLHPIEIIKEYERTILDELDLVREAANASQLRRNFEDSKALYIPKIYWDFCRDNVLVMERIYGIPVGNFKELNKHNVNMKYLGELGVEVFFKQVFTHNFFHADMHPGNIFVDINDPDKPRYIAVDFGIVGTLTPDDKRYLAENFYAFFNRDYKRVAELHLESGWVPQTTRINEFEAAIRTVCEPIFNRPIKEISFGYFLLRLFQTARRFDMEVQPQLVLLQKTLLNIEGLGRQLYPNLDLWTTAKPFLKHWMDEQIGIRSLLNSAKENLPRFIEQLPHMPTMVNDLIQQTHAKQLSMQWESKQLTQLQHSIQQEQQKTRYALIGSVLLTTSIIVFISLAHLSGGLTLISWLGGFSGVLLLLMSFK